MEFDSFNNTTTNPNKPFYKIDIICCRLTRNNVVSIFLDQGMFWKNRFANILPFPAFENRIKNSVQQLHPVKQKVWIQICRFTVVCESENTVCLLEYCLSDCGDIRNNENTF